MGEYDIPVAIGSAAAVTITALIVTGADGVVLASFLSFVGGLGLGFARTRKV